MNNLKMPTNNVQMAESHFIGTKILRTEIPEELNPFIIHYVEQPAPKEYSFNQQVQTRTPRARRGFIPVDSWTPGPGDDIFIADKGYIIVPIAKALGYQDDISNPINYFFLNTKRCYNNMRDHIALYLNYFEKFYDPDHELWAIYSTIKIMMDTQPDAYVEDRFMYDLIRMILDTRSSIFTKVNRMNNDNYCLELSYRNNRNPALQYTEYHAKIMMRASLLMNIVIPLMTHYMYMRGITNTQAFILRIFNYILENLCDGISIINKLYETAATNINKNANDHSRLWEMQNIRGNTPVTHSLGCVDNIIVAIMPKYVYSENIIHFNYKSIINNTKFQITDISYEFTFVTLSSAKRDEDNNSEFDKYESYLMKENEGKFLLNRANYEKTMADLVLAYGPIEPEEIAFYAEELSKDVQYVYDEETGETLIKQNERSNVRDFQKSLVFYLFYKYFEHPYSLREINRVDYIKLIIIAKRMLLKAGMITLPYIIGGRFEVSKVKSINIKERARMESNRLFAQVKAKYFNNEQKLNDVLELISKILASKFTIIDYENEAIHGQPIPIVSDLLIDEILMYVLMI
jgi:hypothetical protein